jgi:hypothetical protein
MVSCREWRFGVELSLSETTTLSVLGNFNGCKSHRVSAVESSQKIYDDARQLRTDTSSHALEDTEGRLRRQINQRIQQTFTTALPSGQLGAARPMEIQSIRTSRQVQVQRGKHNPGRQTAAMQLGSVGSPPGGTESGSQQGFLAAGFNVPAVEQPHSPASQT